MQTRTRSARILLLATAAALALAGAGVAHAEGKLHRKSAHSAGRSQTTDQTATDPNAPTEVSEVVVTAPRSPDSGVKRKRRTEAILDSLTTPEATKLPASSMAEVLQHMPGVTVTQFGGPLNQAGGVAVRGLTQVSSTLNGRESFSANGGRNLLWEDVTPELMAGVDVYKSFTADQIEGGIGGAINLRTHMPFDYKSQTLQGSFSVNYGDLSHDFYPSASVLYSHKWDTPEGRMGVVVDLARAKAGSRTDTIEVAPYLPQQIDGATVGIPSGFDWRISEGDHTRNGLYEAFEWAPTDQLTLFQTAFRSSYSTSSVSYTASNGDGINETVAPGAPGVFANNGDLIQAPVLMLTGYNPLPCQSGGLQCSNLNTDTNVSVSHSQTTDLSFGAEWNSRLWSIKGALQFVDSTMSGGGNDIAASGAVPSFGFSTAGRLPVFSTPAGSGEDDPAQYVWTDTMDHMERHHGQEIAANADAEYQLGDGLFRSVKFGARIADRKQRDNVSLYNWAPLTPGWDYPNVTYLSSAAPGDITIQRFGSFFGGAASMPAAVFPSLSLVMQSIRATHAQYGEPGDTTGPAVLVPQSLSRGAMLTTDGYAIATFARDEFLGMPMNGNLGVRVVHDDKHSQGYIALPTGQVLYQGQPEDLPGGYTENSGGRTDTSVLPSLNLQFEPRHDMRLRFAASQTMAEPSFGAMTAAGSMSVETDSVTRAITYATASVGDPNLRPERATNLDLSLEWYLPNNGLVHVALFHKTIRDYLTSGVFSQSLPFIMPDGSHQVLTAAVTNVFNADQPVDVQGVEVGLSRKLSDFLPHPLDRFSLDANYTYIDGNNPGDLSYDTTGDRIAGLPVDQLSHDNYNIAGSYEGGPWSVRLAYSWRSKYLLTPTGWGTNGSYNDPQTHQAVIYSVPMFGDSYGQLDFAATYKLMQGIALSLEAQNLTGATADTLMGVGSDQVGRSWSVSDRRLMTTVRFSFPG